MLTRTRVNKLFSIALPIISGMISANVLTLVDTAMVGQLGKTAIAAVGLTGFALSLVFATFGTLGGAVQAITSRRAGEARHDDSKLSDIIQPAHAGLIIAAVLGLGSPLILFPLIPHLYPMLTSHADVIAVGQPYMKIMMAGILASCINTTMAGYWNGLGKTKAYMVIIVASHGLNILLNYILIFGKFGAPELGVLGAGIGTLCSQYMVTVGHFVLMFKRRVPGFLKVAPSTALIKSEIGLMWPMGVRAIFQHSGFLIFTILIGRMGEAELAAATVLVRIMLVTIMPAFGLGLGGGALVGQSLGAKEPDEAETWGWDTIKIGAIILFVMGLPLILFPEPILRLLINDAETVALAKTPLVIIGLNRPVCALFIFVTLLFNAGEVKKPTIIQLSIQYVVYLPLVWLFGVHYQLPFLTIWYIDTVYLLVQFILLAWLWKAGAWKTIQL